MNMHTLPFHVGLHVSDIRASTEFYTALLGMAPLKQQPDYAKFDTGNLILSLIARPAKVWPQFGHFGFRLADRNALQAHRDRLLAAGGTVREEMQTDCCYALQDKFWVTDPDGHEWEFYVFLENTEDGLTGKRPVADATSCCSR